MKKIVLAIFLITITTSIFALDIQSKEIMINKNKVHYYQVNNSKSDLNLIMLTGIGTTANFWPKDFIDILSQKYNLYILDYRSLNTDQNGDDLNYSIKSLSEDTNAFIKKLKLKNLYILGWSMGGAVAEQTLFDNTNTFKQAFLISPAVPLDNNPGLPQKLSETPDLKNPRQIYNFVFDNNLYDYNPKNLESEVNRFINPDIANLFPNNNIYTKQKKSISQWVKNKNNLDNFINLNIPTTIFLAKNDKILNPKDTQKTIALIKNKSFINIINFDKSGHAIDWDQSLKLANIINNLA